MPCRNLNFVYLPSSTKTRVVPCGVATRNSVVCGLRSTSRTRQLVLESGGMSWTTIVSPFVGMFSGVTSTSSVVSASKPIHAEAAIGLSRRTQMVNIFPHANKGERMDSLLGILGNERMFFMEALV